MIIGGVCGFNIQAKKIAEEWIGDEPNSLAIKQTKQDALKFTESLQKANSHEKKRLQE